MTGYSAKDVSKLLDLSVGQVRSYARAGFLEPARGPRGEYRFTFQDLVLLRTAKGLMEARVPPRRVRRALRRLRDRLPSGRPLSGLQIVARGDDVVVRSGREVWDPESGQCLFDFDVSRLAERAAPEARLVAARARDAEAELTAEDWFAVGLEVEAASPEDARDAYRRALELDPRLADARVNLGRLLHEVGRVQAAETHYRFALAHRPHDPTIHFNLGVALEDLGRESDALRAYGKAVEHDPRFADAYFNLARLYERLGDRRNAIRCLKTYKSLTHEP